MMQSIAIQKPFVASTTTTRVSSRSTARTAPTTVCAVRRDNQHAIAKVNFKCILERGNKPGAGLGVSASHSDHDGRTSHGCVVLIRYQALRRRSAWALRVSWPQPSSPRHPVRT